ncbi:LOG family protein [Nocardia cyriacigeorgica]|uniref:SLOG cluster 4 domain-containing protein n=1 Tax=Nocardia cyriacigeorgica TaxID=135487 RepID=UPI000CEA55CD|nr:LOG family protein [Nocardia cyriacigeorgica]PPJ13723.1 DNA transporter [Nocardia cyriacigeorgica]
MRSASREKRLTASFFGGVVPATDHDRELARDIGQTIGEAGMVLQHGGYNGLMEDAASGAASAGGPVVAVTLASVSWGEFNPHVSRAIRLSTMGDRLHRFLDGADLVIAMGGGVGTLHELTAALWYAGNIRSVPVCLAGPTALRLATFLRAEHWLFETPTRPLGFLHEIPDLAAFREKLPQLVQSVVPDRLGTVSAGVEDR